MNTAWAALLEFENATSTGERFEVISNGRNDNPNRNAFRKLHEFWTRILDFIRERLIYALDGWLHAQR